MARNLLCTTVGASALAIFSSSPKLDLVSLGVIKTLLVIALSFGKAFSFLPMLGLRIGKLLVLLLYFGDTLLLAT